jgi:glycosyltransferase involved in cell wall biosynthesis
MNNYPRILIYGSPFNNFSGGGITQSNLFKGWPEDKIAVTATGHVLQGLATDVCDTYYLLGNNEERWIFPFNLLQRSFPSGLMSFDNQPSDKPEIRQKLSFRKILVDKLFYPFLQWFGLIHFLSKISFSKEFIDWLNIYKPEILYIQVATREDIQFAIKLHDYLGIPSAIHNMDDWPSTISNKGVFKKYLHNKIDKEFRQLLKRMDLCLSISNAMTSEYLKRYNREFKPFHNPIDTKVWQPYCKNDFSLPEDHVRILYSGRIGVGITESLIEVTNVIKEINSSWGNIKLYIQSPSSDPEVRNRLQKFDCIVINPVAEYSQLPEIFSQVDLLLIANDFDKEGIDYLKFSMPTKVSEYMISGTPILIYASGDSAVSKFFAENECGCCVTEQDPEKLNKALKLLTENKEYRKTISKNAVKIALELFDADKVRNDFQQLIINLVK